MKRVRRLLVIGCFWLPLIALARPEAVPTVALEPAQQQWLDAEIVARDRIDAEFDEQGLTFADQDALYAKKLIAGAVYSGMQRR